MHPACRHLLSSSDIGRCAVIVNDMAELNIDAALVKSGGLVQVAVLRSMSTFPVNLSWIECGWCTMSDWVLGYKVSVHICTCRRIPGE